MRGKFKVEAMLSMMVLTAGLPSRGAAADQGLEIFTYWTAGGEADGLAALEKVFSAKHPGVQIRNAVVAGGAGSNATAVLATRMQGGNPPDTFQIHGGAELIDTWVKTGFMEPLTKLYKDEGLDQKFPKQLIDLVSYQGQPYSVPVNVHRNGVLWFNKKIFSDNGLTPPETWDAFFAAADKLKAKGITPLALGDKDKWESLQLFEDILLATLGPDDYKALWAGRLAWTDPRITKALETMKRVVGYVNDDHATLTWDQATGLVLRGKAAMNLMGDWAKGYFTSNGWEVGTDFGWAPAPGTKGSFIVVTDTFGLPKKVKNRAAALEWLAVLASVPGQDAFNPKKGSIPARVDADKSKYDAYSKGAMADFAANALVPSEANGPATVPAFLTPITDAISGFVNDKDVARAQSTIAQACRETVGCAAGVATAKPGSGASSTGSGQGQ
ncbi:ABC transporter substrate-binding protein [Anaeromyxobacter oryzae]|uniref:Probable sugar-binding periplasmic protein n=1 Tax=Anaeromyxobacter oryzae TaxID=2918170 RepID=A0ABM7X1R6_9BACT|nr:extracellular solute-binding protein [Anaeromyxobacter oryzae]BDG05735.1 ABC transporter substrate-binding protein [Anaeromyxobacter oryzae]